ncbi:hypothetical protein LXA43DRAFT_11925 [Ganoderma leucocontextum]|nr:hypothetical protein LXA43DRAFT_11925 [Ganoderma leucocontextum]
MTYTEVGTRTLTPRGFEPVRLCTAYILHEATPDLPYPRVTRVLIHKVSPLHTDSYCNLYNLFVSSEPSLFCKHIVLLPPSASEYLTRMDDAIRHSLSSSSGGQALVTTSSTWASTQGKYRQRRHTPCCRPRARKSCVPHEGDTLFVPCRWWHGAENVVGPSAAANGKKRGWTAGVGWWFLPPP